MKSARVLLGTVGFLCSLWGFAQLSREEVRLGVDGKTGPAPSGREVSFRPSGETAALPPASGTIETVGIGNPAAAKSIFSKREDVFLAAGSASSPCQFFDYLTDGKYYFQVTDATGLTLLSTDPVSERAVNVKGGVISSYAGTTHSVDGKTACGSLAVNLMPYADAGPRKAAYIVWLTSAASFDGSPTVIDPVCGAGCFHGFHPDLSRAVSFRVEDKVSCEDTFCVSGVKFSDLNGNGIRDTGEPGLPGVEIRVTTVNGVVLSALTGPDGSYRICGLTSSDFFRVSERVPFGFSQTGPLDKVLGRRLFAKDLGFVIEQCDQDSAGLDFGNRALPGAIGGLKFEDLNANGVRDPGEPPLAGVTIRLTPTSPAGAEKTTVTDLSGNFLFTDLPAGTYQLNEVVPNGFTQTVPPSDGITVVLASGGSSLNNVFGNFRGILTGSISGVKFEDRNGNGSQDAGEPGISGVVINATSSPPQTTRTTLTGLAGGAGGFLFAGLPFGTWTISEVVPTGFAQTVPAPPGTITVTLDFGHQAITGLAFGNRALPSSISGTKFNDINGNGARDAGEPGLAAVTIQLRNSAGLLTSATTDASGNFSFPALAADTYTLSEVVPAGFLQTAPPSPGTFPITLGPGQDLTGFLFGNRAAPASISGLKFNDINGNGVRDAGEGPVSGVTIQLKNAANQTVNATTDTSGNFTFPGLAAGTYVLSEVVPPGFVQTVPAGGASITTSVVAGQNATGFLFGNQALGTISGTKFNDANGNGARDAGEPGLSGVTIQLRTAIPGQILTATTDSSGNFTFSNLPAGPYALSEVVPAGFVQTAPAAPGTFTITLAAGQNATGFLFGNQALGSIAGTKFNDANGNAARDTGEPGVAGVTIQLRDASGNLTSTTSDSSGNFSFTGLRAGSYTLSEVVPAGFVQTLPGGGASITVLLAAGQNAGGFLFGNQAAPPGSISGTKFNDLNGNGTRDSGEPGLQGVTINLKTPAPSSQTLSAVTDASGNFTFPNLAAGTYVLSEVVPANFTQTAPATPGTFTIALTAGQNAGGFLFGNRAIPLGSIAGTKFNDANGNGTRDAGEVGLQGVTINLQTPSGTLTTTTDASGNFSFINLTAGSYVLSEVVPAGFTQTAPVAPGTFTISLTSGQNATGFLFGNRAIQPGSISGTKFNDANGNGSLDAGETGVQGVTIQLKTPLGTTLSTTTDASGNFTFPNLAAGSYVLSEIVPTGFVQTAPAAPGTFAITLAAGQNATGFLFGNRIVSPGSIAGLKILDLDANGVVNGLDRPLEGIVFVLTDSNGVKRQATSASDGTFKFSNLPAGTYNLQEVLPPNFFQTFPGTATAPKGYTIQLSTGQNATGFLFLNKC